MKFLLMLGFTLSALFAGTSAYSQSYFAGEGFDQPKVGPFLVGSSSGGTIASDAPASFLFAQENDYKIKLLNTDGSEYLGELSTNEDPIVIKATNYNLDEEIVKNLGSTLPLQGRLYWVFEGGNQFCNIEKQEIWVSREIRTVEVVVDCDNQ